MSSSNFDTNESDPTQAYPNNESEATRPVDTTALHGSTLAPQPMESSSDIVLGPYRLRHKLGQGGMGEVWLADQFEPVKRQVAIKLIKAGISSKEVLARFEAERQALALMSHPNIARILDAGSSPDGQPYFAMELVEGVPFTDYCDQHSLSINERLALFCDVCSGVQHAHQKGIIHRDLKPSNILVTSVDGKPVVKVIDFGLAKAMDQSQRLTDQPMFTGLGQILGTLKYMSPEQAGLDSTDIDTRTDIYALGVILYELLTGNTPLDDPSIKGKALIDLLEVIREHEPARPSSRLGSSSDAQISAVTLQRKTDSSKLRRILSGDLDWIVMKSLEKDRNRRYESVSGFAADITRYLNSEPVAARPPSINYRLQKFIRKNRVSVISGSLVLLALVGGVIGTSWGLWRAIQAQRKEMQQRTFAEKKQQEAEQERKIAEAKRQEAEQNLEYARRGIVILGSLFASIDPKSEFATVSQLRDALTKNVEKAVADLKRSEIDDPLVIADLQCVFGDSLLNLGKYEQAVALFENAYYGRHQKLGPDQLPTLRALTSLGTACKYANDEERAIRLHQEALERKTKVLGETHPATILSMHELAQTYEHVGDHEHSLPLLVKAFELVTKDAGASIQPTEALAIEAALANAFHSAGQVKNGLQMLEKILQRQRDQLGPDHLSTLICMSNLAEAYKDVGRNKEALPLLETTFARMQATLGNDHPATLTTLNNLASALQSLGQLNQAAPLFELCVELSQKRFGDNHRTTLNRMNNLAHCYSSMGQTAKSIDLYERTLSSMKEHLGPDNPDTLSCSSNLASAYNAQGKPAEAASLLESALVIANRRLGADHKQTLTIESNLASTYQILRQLDKAIPLLESTLKKTQAQFGEAHLSTIVRKGNLATGYMSIGKLDEALELMKQSANEAKQAFGADHPETLRASNKLAMAYYRLSRFEEALPIMRSTFEASEKKLGAEHPDSLTAMNNLAMCYQDCGDLPRATELLVRVYDLKKTKLGQDHPSTLTSMNNLAAALSDAGKNDEALPIREELLLLVRKKLGAEHPDTLVAMNNLGELYRSMGQLPKALPLYKEATKSIEKIGFHSEAAQSVINNTILAHEEARDYTEADRLREKWLAFVIREKGEESTQYASALSSHGLALLNRQNWDEAVQVIEQCLKLRRKLQPEEWTTFSTESMLGAGYLKQKKIAEAERLLNSGLAGMQARKKKIPPTAQQRVTEALDRLIELYQVLNKPDLVEKYKQLRTEHLFTGSHSPPAGK